MKKNILIVPGDGIGQEVTAVGKQILDRVAERFGHEFSYDEALVGHVAIEATGSPLPEGSLAKMRASDAVLFGAVGHPKYDNDPSAKVRPEQGLLKMRKELGLYANLRPIKLFDELLDASSIKADILRGADILFFRELTGGLEVDRFDQLPIPYRAIAANIENGQTVIMDQGQTGREAYVILEGSATVKRNGKKIGSAKTGAVVGELSLLDNGPRTATVTATWRF